MAVFVCPSHETALDLWRLWSHSHPLSVREFHRRSASKAADLPASVFASSTALGSCAATETEARRLLSVSEACGDKGAGFGALPGESDLMRRLRCVLVYDGNFWNAAEVPWEMGDVRVHVAALRRPGMASSRALRLHHCAGKMPRGALLKISSRLLLCSPELAFVQMGSQMPFGALVALGYELCGCYPSVLRGGRVVRRPLTNPARLRAFCDRVSSVKGVKAARAAARFIMAKSASVMETELAVVLSLSKRRGGLGYTGARLNELVKLSPGAARIARCAELSCDILWPDAKVAFEYDSALHVGSVDQMVRDARKRDALAANGIKLWSVTHRQFESILEFEEISARALRGPSGPRKPMTSDQLTRHGMLRHEIAVFHRRRSSGRPLSAPRGDRASRLRRRGGSGS
ncbi:hypothetical protein VIN30_09435 [Adlercreutzia sp. R7]|uniref:DUF559 domain-containing protein n=1 Tax=Adlercreutzia wanghongyangiae TaxID=3111451 RepID=A0ABU6IJR2_9ACTN|nr:hypothetical protein [Adlercreutzia sp. R7]